MTKTLNLGWIEIDIDQNKIVKIVGKWFIYGMCQTFWKSEYGGKKIR